ncbi:MAG: DUF5719 family protein [Acidimicrobiia bacterium]
MTAPDTPETPRIGMRTRIGVLVAIVAVLAVAVGVSVVRDSSAAATSPTSLPLVAVPDAKSDSATWFCAAGTATKDGNAAETVVIANVGSSSASVNVSVYSGVTGAPPAARSLQVDARSQTKVKVADIAEVPEPAVTVEARGGQVVVEHSLDGFDDAAVGPCARRGSASWYFPNGTTAKGFDQNLVIFNPYPDEAVVDVSFFTEEGVKRPEGLSARSVPRRSRITIPVHEEVRRNDIVAAVVQARTGRVVAERVMTATGSDGPRGIALSLGAPELSTAAFSLPESVRSDAFAGRVIVLNPSDRDTTVQATVQTRNELSFSPYDTTVPARSATPVRLPDGLPANEPFSLVVRPTDGTPIAVEQWVVAKNKPKWLATAEGSPVTARSWVVAAARTGANDFVVVENPGTQPVRVSVSEVGERNGPTQRDAFEVASGRSAKVALADLSIGDSSSVILSGDGQFTVFRVGDDGATRSVAIPFLG